MPKYRTTFVQVDGLPLPEYVHPILDRTGVFRTYFRRPGLVLERGKGTIQGAVLRAAGRVELSRQWWDRYFNLKHGTPLPEPSDDEVAERGHVVPGSWDALIAHFETHNAQWRRNKASTQRGTRIYLKKIGEALGPRGAEFLDMLFSESIPGEGRDPPLHHSILGDRRNPHRRGV